MPPSVSSHRCIHIGWGLEFLNEAAEAVALPVPEIAVIVFPPQLGFVPPLWLSDRSQWKDRQHLLRKHRHAAIERLSQQEHERSDKWQTTHRWNRNKKPSMLMTNTRIQGTKMIERREKKEQEAFCLIRSENSFSSSCGSFPDGRKLAVLYFRLLLVLASVMVLSGISFHIIFASWPFLCSSCKSTINELLPSLTALTFPLFLAEVCPTSEAW